MTKMIDIASNSRLNAYPLGERRRLFAKVDSPPTWRGIRITLDFTLNKPYAALVAGAGDHMPWPRRERIEEKEGASGMRPNDLAFERHYSVSEIVELWGLSEKTIRRIFSDEPDVLEWGHDEQRFKRAYRTLRIPESVLQRVHRRIRKAS
jgi:hypothetical protein